MNKVKILKILDLTSLVTLLFSAIFIGFFEFTANKAILKVSVGLFAIGILCLLVFLGIKIYLSVKKNDETIEIFQFSKSELILTVVKISLTFIALCWIIFIFFKV